MADNKRPRWNPTDADKIVIASAALSLATPSDPDAGITTGDILLATGKALNYLSPGSDLMQHVENLVGPDASAFTGYIIAAEPHRSNRAVITLFNPERNDGNPGPADAFDTNPRKDARVRLPSGFEQVRTDITTNTNQPGRALAYEAFRLIGHKVLIRKHEEKFGEGANAAKMRVVKHIDDWGAPSDPQVAAAIEQAKATYTQFCQANPGVRGERPAPRGQQG